METRDEYRKWGLTKKMKCASMMGMTKNLMTAKEVAEVLGVTPQTVNAWARAGILPYFDIGPKTRRFLIFDIVNHVKKSVVVSEEKSNGQAVAETVD